MSLVNIFMMHIMNMVSYLSIVCVLLLVTKSEAATNSANGSPVVVLAAAEESNDYYNPATPTADRPNRYYDIIKFHAQFAKELIKAGTNVVISCDEPTCDRLLDQGAPNDILWRSPIQDIWMRDMSRASLTAQAGFIFEPNYMSRSDARAIQKSFDDAFAKAGIQFPPRENYIIDGGNVVDNFVDAAVLTDRVMSENRVSFDQAVRDLKEIFGYKFVCLVPEIAGDTTGHSDGMVSFVNQNTLLYAEFDDETVDLDGKKSVNSMREALTADLAGSGIQFFGVPYYFPSDIRVAQGYDGFTTACGTHLNALYTGTKLFVPVFAGDPGNVAAGITKEADDAALKVIRAHAGSTEVYTVQVPQNICQMGGNVRCLSYLLDGQRGNTLVNFVAAEAAKYDAVTRDV